jgi:molecular chaperone GrpE
MTNRKKRKDELAKKETESLAEKKSEPLVATEEQKKTENDPRDLEIEELKRHLAEKSDLAQGYFAQLQRVQADFENYQKRVEAERSRIADSACETIVSGLLDTLDNFERAITHLEKLPGDEARGVLMVYQNMMEYLKGNGLEKIASAGCQFDPYRHDAIMRAEVDDATEGTVLEEFQAGYTMKGKVIRPSKVKVAREKKIDDDKVKEE